MEKFFASKKRAVEEPASVDGSIPKMIKKNESFKIVTMNSNSLANRISDKKHHAEFKTFMEEHAPDVVAVQEVRLPAKSFSSKPKKNDGSKRDRTKIDDKDSKAATDKHLLQNCAAFRDYQMYYSLSDWRYAGTMVALRKGSVEPSWIEYTFLGAEEKSIKHQSSKIAEVQESSSLPATSSSVSTLSTDIGVTEGTQSDTLGAFPPVDDGEYETSCIMDGHYADGRLICMGFPSFDLLATYSPNNGSSETSFLRRRLWDKDVLLFLTRAEKRGRPIIWVGDLNVAHTPADVTHPSFFLAQMHQPEKGDSGQAGERQAATLLFLSWLPLLYSYSDFPWNAQIFPSRKGNIYTICNC
jgi:exonuclease III